MRPVELPTTVWTALRRAQEDPATLDVLLRGYYPPILAYLRNQGLPEPDAEEVAQDVLLALVKGEVLRKADPAKGRFRSLVLTITRHALSARRRHDRRRKRGGDVDVVALTEGLAAPAEEDPSFDELWVSNLVRIAMRRLWEEGGRPYEALERYSAEAPSYEALAEKLGASVTDVKNWLHQARLKLKRYVRQEIDRYAGSREEYERELAYLSRFLTEPGR